MKRKIPYTIVNYFGDYGTANFWSNVRTEDIVRDFDFIQDKGFNTIILLVPYALFKPRHDTFENKYSGIFEHILAEAAKRELHVVLRIGYLWESNFEEIKTFERYTDMFRHFKEGTTSRFEADFISFINHYYASYNILHMVLSWEDLYWPIRQVYPDKHDPEIMDELIAFAGHLLNGIGEKEKLHIEQRSNGDMMKIPYNQKITYSYYNTLNITTWNDDMIDKKFYNGVLVSQSMVVEKHFVEWYSRMKEALDLGKTNGLIIDQFNIIDNTFADDIDHNIHANTRRKLICGEETIDAVLAFLSPIIEQHIMGIGVWSLWTTYSGHIYNGTFALGTEGWETNGRLIEGSMVMEQKNVISTNLGYVRLDNKRSWNILLCYTTLVTTRIMITFNNTRNIVCLEPGTNKRITLKYAYVIDKQLTITCITGAITIHRIDCYTLMHTSYLFDEHRNPIGGEQRLKLLIG